MNMKLRIALAIFGAAVATQAAAQMVFYERENFEGRSFTAERSLGDLGQLGFNDRASSVVVLRDQWEACEDVRFGGRCIVLRPGRYPSLAAMGLNDRVSSVRSMSASGRVHAQRYAPAPWPVYDNHRRGQERLYQAQVTSVRAVLGPSEQRCWVEREQVVQDHGDASVPGAIIGAVIGGVLGHQVGGGRGKDVATVGGAVAGGVVGANVGRGTAGSRTGTRDVQRCASAPSQAPAYWDVTYNFRGIDHTMQVTSPPRPSVTVNRHGEPRA
jgi:uncharacterized protein YcfJ